MNGQIFNIWLQVHAYLGLERGLKELWWQLSISDVFNMLKISDWVYKDILLTIVKYTVSDSIP